MSCHVAPDSISELRHVETLRRPAEGLYGLAAFGLFSTCQMLGIPKNVQLSCALQATSHQALPVRKGVILSGRRGPLYYVVASIGRDFQDVPSVYSMRGGACEALASSGQELLRQSSSQLLKE